MEEVKSGQVVYVLLEEIASGSQNGETCWIHGVYRTPEARTAAVKAWMKSHDNNGEDHGYDDEEEEEEEEEVEPEPQEDLSGGSPGWCQTCGWGLTVSDVQLEG